MVKHKEDQDIALKIDHSSFFWGFDKHKAVKDKIDIRKVQKDHKIQEISHKSESYNS